MATAKKSSAKTRRGSPEAIAKRRAARSLNNLFEKGAAQEAMDGRTLKRKNRLLQELKEGRGGEAIKAHEVLGYATELFGMGENLTSIRALKPKLPPKLPLTPETVAVIRDTQNSYGYDPRAWTLLGIDIESVMKDEAEAEAEPPKRRKKK